MQAGNPEVSFVFIWTWADRNLELKHSTFFKKSFGHRKINSANLSKGKALSEMINGLHFADEKA